MKIFKIQKFAKFQQGAILLVLFFVLFVFGSTIFLSATNSGSLESRQRDEVRYQMELAKAALISYALNYETFNIDGDGDGDFDDEGPGHLPCPDFNNDGILSPNIAKADIRQSDNLIGFSVLFNLRRDTVIFEKHSLTVVKRLVADKCLRVWSITAFPYDYIK